MNPSNTLPKIGDRVRVVSVMTAVSDVDDDRYLDKIGQTATVADATYIYGSDIDCYSLRFDSPEGSVLLDPFYADELEVIA